MSMLGAEIPKSVHIASAEVATLEDPGHALKSMNAVLMASPIAMTMPSAKIRTEVSRAAA
jgi:hypothetical protein